MGESLKHTNYIKRNNSNFVWDGMTVIYEVLLDSNYRLSYLDIEEELVKLVPTQWVKRLVLLSVEMLQNIIKHKDTIPYEEEAIFFITKDDSNILLIGGNLVNSKNLGYIINKIEYINSLDKESLVKYYHEVLNNKGFSEKGGAGLGLIEMARKTNHKIEYVIKNAARTSIE